MKKLKIIGLLLIVFFISGCNNQKNERVINVLNWSSYIPSEVIRDFEKETGIKVNYSTYSSNEELLAKISSAKKGTYDLIFPSDYMIEIMISRDMLKPLDLTKLTNYQNLNPEYLNNSYDENNKYSIPFIAASTIIAYNKDLTDKRITSYNDLLDPSFLNSVVLIDDQRIIIGMALLANGFDMNSTNEEELEIAKDWLLKLKPNIKAYDSDSPKNFLITKEASVAVLWNAEGALAKSENPNIQTVFPNEGFAISIDNFAIPAGAKHEDDTYRFIDYILEAEVMKKIIESYPYKSVNIKTDAILSSEYLNSSASNIPDSVYKLGTFVENVGENIKKYDKIWIEIK